MRQQPHFFTMSYFEVFSKEFSKEQALNLVQNWSNQNSHSLNKEGLDKQRLLLEKVFVPLGDHFSLHKIPPYQTLSKTGQTHSFPFSKALLVEKRPSASLQVLLLGHYDTVFPKESPFQTSKLHPCKQILQGPGVIDMKGGLVILFYALKAFEALKESKEIGWKLLLIPDEEVGSSSSTPLMQKIASQCHLGLIPEPPLVDGSLVKERGGSWNFLLSSKGKSAHVGRDFASGSNAIYPLCDFIQELSKKKRKDLLINVGTIHGGEGLNVVPPFAQCGINIRATELSLLHEMQKQVKQSTEAQNLNLHTLSFRPPKPSTPESEKLFSLYASCSADLGQPLNFRSSNGVCDGNTLAATGLPTIDTIGAKGSGLHTPDECLEISSLEEKSKVLFLFLYKLAKMPAEFI